MTIPPNNHTQHQCLSYLVESPKLLTFLKVSLFAIAMISVVAGILATVGSLGGPNNPFFSSVPLAAGITMIIGGIGLVMAILLFIEKIELPFAISDMLSQIERKRQNGEIDATEYGIRRDMLLNYPSLQRAAPATTFL